MLNFIEGVKLSKICDYSFGDQASIICGIPGGYIKNANLSNYEFIEQVNKISMFRNYMTLFIDNIRLYKRKLLVPNISDQVWIDNLMEENDLLKLCSNFPEMKFIIFTNLEDTPIDEQIEGKIPNNVYIYAINAVYHNNRVTPIPYGIQRKMFPSDNREVILSQIISESIQPNKLIYVNHNINTNTQERSGIYEIFTGKDWATTDETRLSYDFFLRRIKSHKFMICPIGNAVDCHRNWEVLYLKRVPVMKKNTYLEYLFRDFPVLFVNDYSDVTEELLIEKEDLYQSVLDLNIYQLDLYNLYDSILRKEII